MNYRILLINWQDISNPLGGGAEVHAHEIFKRISLHGHRVTQLCCRYGNAPGEEVIDGIHIVRRGNRSIFNFIVPAEYRALHRTATFDIVFDDINKIPFYTPLYVKEPLIAIVHHFFGRSIYLETGMPQAIYVRAAERAIIPIYRRTRFITVSESTRRELIAWGLRCNRIDIVQNAVDHGSYIANLNDKDREPLIGYVGRLKRYKCIEHIIQVMPKVVEHLPHARLLIVGGGDHCRKLEKLVSDLALNSHVRFTGTVSHEEKVRYLNRMWVTINPSPKEGWGLTVVEANACGTPVIAANSPGLRDSVVDMETGLLYPWGKLEALYERIKLVVENRALRTQLQINAIEWARKFNWDHSAAMLAKIIQETVT